MNTVPVDTDGADPSGRRQGFGQRLMARHGATAIMVVVLLVVVGWIGALGWGLLWLFGQVHL